MQVEAENRVICTILAENIKFGLVYVSINYYYIHE